MLREGGGDAEGFVEVWTADVEFGDLVPAAEHGVCDGYCWGGGYIYVAGVFYT